MDCPNEPKEWRWRRLGPEQESRLSSLLVSWHGTPYRSGSRARGLGCDCTNFVCGVLDVLYRKEEPTKLPAIPINVASHDRRVAYQTVDSMLHSYRPIVCRSKILEPGDILIVRNTTEPAARNPGHVMIVGTERWTAFHAIDGPGVCKTSVFANTGIMRVYRPIRKASWVNPQS